VILNDVPLADLPPGYADGLEDVRNGGGLAMVGGPQSFGLGGYRGSAVEEALPVRMKARQREEPSSIVALIIDKSGSMREESRILYAREAARQLVVTKDHDRITVISFDRQTFTIVPHRRRRSRNSTSASAPEAFGEHDCIRLSSRRGAAGRRRGATTRHIIVLSDGLSGCCFGGGQRLYYDLALGLANRA
jgi:Mg-chelatase subunit ChlD